MWRSTAAGSSPACSKSVLASNHSCSPRISPSPKSNQARIAATAGPFCRVRHPSPVERPSGGPLRVVLPSA